jgi:hypothetical protein
MTDMFFGSREGRVADPFGNVWTIATLKEEVAPKEMQRRMDARAGLLTLQLGGYSICSRDFISTTTYGFQVDST